MYFSQSEFKISILVVVEPLMSSSEFTVIGVDVLLQKEIKNNKLKTSLRDFTSLF